MVAAWMSALLSSSSRAVSRWPFPADWIRAVRPSCGHAGRGVGRRARDHAAGGRQGIWPILACAQASCARLRAHGWMGGRGLGRGGEGCLYRVVRQWLWWCHDA